MVGLKDLKGLFQQVVVWFFFKHCGNNLILKVISFCTLAGKYKYTMWQGWQLPSQREWVCLLVRGVGFHNSIINFYQTCTEHLWHIKQPLHGKKLQLSACIGAAADLQAGWKNLCKKPLVAKGEKYKQIYLVEDIYCRRIVSFFLYQKSSISYNLSLMFASLPRYL